MGNGDWERGGIEHLEREGCIINIRKGFSASNGDTVTSVEILADNGWMLDGSGNNRVVKK